MHRLRDVVATYTLDEIFSFDKYGEALTADQRVIKEIEDKVKETFDPSGGGVWFKGVDIRKIQALLGHDKLETTARYTRVATGMIAEIASPLDVLGDSGRKRKGKKRSP